MFTNLPEQENQYILATIRGIASKLLNYDINDLLIGELLGKMVEEAQNSEFWRKVNNLIPNQFAKDIPIQEIKIEEIEKLAKWFQNSLESTVRKDYAANYTSISAIDIMNSVYLVEEHDHVIDPFSGSGRLLMGLLRSIPPNKEFPHISINEFMLFPCLLGYYDVICYFQERDQDINKISVNIGDAFENFKFQQKEKFDLVLMNPPFTRIHRINPKTKENLKSLISSYPDLIIGQPGLHYFALLLANDLLKTNGKVISILPGSTFLSLYSKPLLAFYLDNYKINNLVKLDNSLAFSDGSEFKEVVFSATKTKRKFDHKIKFIITSLSSSEIEILESVSVSSSDLYNNWNWLKYFENRQLLTLEKHLLSRNLILSGQNLNVNIIRGVEMYGPNFFCIPNSHWKIQSKTDSDVILESNSGRNRIYMGKRYLVKALRKSGKYNTTISPEFDDYLLSVPYGESNEKSIKAYSQKNIDNSNVAKKRFGEHWIHHIDNQIYTKDPFGYLFLIDKLSIETSSVVCHFFDNPVSATKNFYIVKSTPQELKLQAAWINSSCFLIIYLVNRREIGGKFGRMQIVDFLNTPLFMDYTKISQTKKDIIINKFDKIRFQELPRIPNQIGKEYRKELDLAILSALGFERINAIKILEEIYSSLKQKLS